MSVRFRDIVFYLERKLDRLLGAYDDPLPPSHNTVLAALAESYGIEIVSEHASSDPRLSYEQPDERQKRICADLLASELKIYPQEIIEASRVERIILCSKLSSYGCVVAGLTQAGLLVVDSIYLDADRIGRNWDYARKAFHHELFHAIDFHDNLLGYLDPGWNEMNPQGFSYEMSRRHHIGYNEPCDSPGFLSTYARTSVQEDKAELYAHLIVHYADVQKRLLSDRFLAAKVEAITLLLKKFSARFDDDFWHHMDQRCRHLSVARHSQWSAALSAYDKAHIQSKRLTESPRPKETLLQVSTKTENGRRLFLAAWREPEPPHTEQVAAFYTFNKLRAFLSASGIREIPPKEMFLSETQRFYLDRLPAPPT